MQSRYVDNSYRIISPGEHFWTSIYNYSGKSLRCTSFKKPVEVVVDRNHQLINVPGYKGRKIPRDYWGYLYSTEQLASQEFETKIKRHLMTMQDSIEDIILSLQALCKRDPQIQSMREVNDIKQLLSKYA